VSLFHERLKELRLNKNWTQQKLADELSYLQIGITMKKQTISAYEKNIEPNIATLNLIARIFNVSVDYLTGNSDRRNIEEELLHSSNIFSNETIKSLSMFSTEEMLILETLITNPLFKQLLGLFDYYQNMPESVVENYGELFYSDKSTISKLRITLNQFELKKHIVRPTLTSTIDRILDDLDDIKKSELIEQMPEEEKARLMDIRKHKKEKEV